MSCVLSQHLGASCRQPNQTTPRQITTCNIENRVSHRRLSFNRVATECKTVGRPSQRAHNGLFRCECRESQRSSETRVLHVKRGSSGQKNLGYVISQLFRWNGCGQEYPHPFERTAACLCHICSSAMCGAYDGDHSRRLTVIHVSSLHACYDVFLYIQSGPGARVCKLRQGGTPPHVTQSLHWGPAVTGSNGTLPRELACGRRMGTALSTLSMYNQNRDTSGEAPVRLLCFVDDEIL
jgi:hypothetical protein